VRTAAAVAAALALAGCATTGGQIETPRQIAVETDAVPAGQALQPNMNALMGQTSPSYVTLIVSERRKKQIDSAMMPEALTAGSGFVVDQAGHVMSAAHVAVKTGNEVEVRASNGKIYAGRVVAAKPNNDMSLIRLQRFSGTPVRPAASTCLKPGEPVFSLGRPHAQGDTARIGQLEAMSFGRAVSYQSYGYPDAMVLRLNTKKGESGGPVFNRQGELVGMVVSTLSDGNGQPLNLAHAIPLATIAQFVCANISCGPDWQAVSRQDPSRCPSSVASSG
jgi:S1-C subfamily serine protease